MEMLLAFIEKTRGRALAEIERALGLSRLPSRIECYDISTTQGSATVGSMVVFVHGVPRKGEYRRFKVRTVVDKSDDYGSLQEVLRRRFRRAVAERNGERDGEGAGKIDASFAVMPDVILIDTRQPHLPPLYNPASHLVYAATGADIQTVVVEGRLLVEDRQLLSFDLAETLARAREQLAWLDDLARTQYVDPTPTATV